ncbi:hypothetical protein KUTeg_002443 [Tegillarca granosa]|uniref:Signal peptidase complex subunit 1 n=1 Tax=Tegillarca granosa TaxID=220873 RepID=A0ABQ9FUD2_TEGGR|nr:hypothetical protein KUTeg_002443 [Tegillarca granosa]
MYEILQRLGQTFNRKSMCGYSLPSSTKEHRWFLHVKKRKKEGNMEYLEKFVPESIKKLPVHMDFEGQKKAERLFQIIIGLFGVVGFVWGYICQQFSQTMYILIAGFVLSCLLTLPPWPMYRRKPLQWQKSREENTDKESSSASQSAQKTKKKK